MGIKCGLLIGGHAFKTHWVWVLTQDDLSIVMDRMQSCEKGKAKMTNKSTGILTGPKRRGYRGIEANGSGRERVVLTVILVYGTVGFR